MAFDFITRWVRGGLRREPGLQLPTPTTSFTTTQYSVTEETAMQISAVWAAVQLKANILGSLDLNFYRRQGNGRVPAMDHHLAKLMNGKVNRYQTRVEFFETVGLNLYLSGNAYVLKQRTGQEITGLLPLMSSQVETELMRDGSIVYTYTDGQNVQAYSEDSIWHLKLFGNGIKGLSPLQYAKNSVSVALAAEDWASKQVGNGGKPTGVLMYDKILSPEQRTQIREKFSELREGTADALMVLEAGMNYQQISLSPQDVQLLESRRFQIEDIARFFNVPSVMINDTSGSTVWGSGIEQIITGWYKLGFRPELERIETSIVSNLLPPKDRGVVTVEFDFEQLLRTDFKTRVETGAKAVGAGLMTRNEWRRREWLPEVEGADELTAQVNLLPLDELAAQASPMPVEERSQPVIVNVDTGDPVFNLRAAIHTPEVKNSYHQEAANYRFEMPVIPAPNVTVENLPPEVKCEPVINVDQAPLNFEYKFDTGPLVDAMNSNGDKVKGAVDGVKAEVAKPTKAVFDKDGNPVGSRKVDKL